MKPTKLNHCSLEGLQLPLRNQSRAGVCVNGHSGEFLRCRIDIAIPGLGLGLKLTRVYSSFRADTLGLFGYGWSCNYSTRLEQVGDAIRYIDEIGRAFVFERRKGSTVFETSSALYARLEDQNERLTLHRRYGRSVVFESPDRGGKLLELNNANGFGVSLRYYDERIEIRQSLDRKVRLFVRDALITRVEDGLQSEWNYTYNKANCLVKAQLSYKNRKLTADYYGYSPYRQLTRWQSFKGKRNLENCYDTYGRVSSQSVDQDRYKFSYQQVGGSAKKPIFLTTVVRNGIQRWRLLHNAAGNVIRRGYSVLVRMQGRRAKRRSTAEIVSRATYNCLGELVSRRFPSGQMIRQRFDEGNPSPLNRGNVKTRRLSLDRNGDLEFTYKHEQIFQRCTQATTKDGWRAWFEYDKKGNLSAIKSSASKKQKFTFHYNRFGLLTGANGDGLDRLRFSYFPSNDPFGVGKSLKGRRHACDFGGLLAQRTRLRLVASNALEPRPVSRINFSYNSQGRLNGLFNSGGTGLIVRSRQQFETANAATKFMPFRIRRTNVTYVRRVRKGGQPKRDAPKILKDDVIVYTVVNGTTGEKVGVLYEYPDEVIVGDSVTGGKHC